MRNSPLLNYEPRSKAAGKRVQAPANNYGSCCSSELDKRTRAMPVTRGVVEVRFVRVGARMDKDLCVCYALCHNPSCFKMEEFEGIG